MPYDQPYCELTRTLRKHACELLAESRDRRFTGYEWLRGCNTRPGQNGELRARVSMLARPVRDGNGERKLNFGRLEAALIIEGAFHDDTDVMAGFSPVTIRLGMGQGLLVLPGVEEHLRFLLPATNNAIAYALRGGMYRAVARKTLDLVNGTVATGVLNAYRILQGE